MLEIANRIGQLETNIATERTERMDAEQHVQILTAHPGASSVDRVDQHEGVAKAWQAAAKGGGTTGRRSCCPTPDSWTGT